jgi:protein-L-isoaspartate(D-aspartate) O-methyltransferase
MPGRAHPWRRSLLLVAAAACTRQGPSERQTSEVSDASTAATDVPSRPRPADDTRADERKRLVRETLEARGIEDTRVLAAFRKVRRHEFVPEPNKHLAYTDRPLPIGQGQTISQPYIVALMTEAVLPKPTDRCLEIGTGSGYQAAILVELCAKVFSIEYVPELAELARRQLQSAGYGRERIELRTGDGYRGWAEAAPFDVIVVTAAPPSVPAPLQAQLATGGRLVIPVGGASEVQRLELWTRKKPGAERSAFEVKELAPVRFVPFVGEATRR